ncbi:MAG: hypothetical protein EVA69_01070 [OM182 bacterium]|uniref:Uncharacterized protein n=1 Tax=OM182 bacterium TaxID=2510334 RepID=A0A520S6C1_9GAMM|nr:MAG: hypothetical protein EVA69_01070 [OM182 bacterium]
MIWQPIAGVSEFSRLEFLIRMSPTMTLNNPSALFGVFMLVLLSTATARAEVHSVFVQSRLDYNAILITEVDVLFVYNDAVLDGFPATKTEWYSNKRGFLESAGDHVDLVSIFVPQGFDSEMASLPQRRADAIKIFVFGQHDGSTRAPIDITDFENVLVEIDQFGILVSERN